MAAFAASGPAAARAQFSVEPAIVQLAPHDSAEVVSLTIKNHGAQDLPLRFYLADYEQTEDGSHTFLPGGSHAHSCAGRLSIFPDGATIPAGGHQAVRVRMEPGTQTCWSVVFVQHTAISENGFRIGQRIGVKVHGVPRGATMDGEVTAVEVLTAGGAGTASDPAAAPPARPRAVAVVFQNRGIAPLRPRGALEIRSLAGEVVQRVDVEAFTVLPDHGRRLEIRLPTGLPAGRYVAVPILDFGGHYLAAGQAIVHVP